MTEMGQEASAAHGPADLRLLASATSSQLADHAAVGIDTKTATAAGGGGKASR